MTQIGTYLILMNSIGFIIMYIDKRKAINHKWRISEQALMTISIIGGSIGMLLGMNIFRHKTKHKLFTIGVPLILTLQILIIIYFFTKFI